MIFRFIIIIIVSLSALPGADDPDSLSTQAVLPKKPVLALGLSAITPGGGQYYNGKWGKGLIFTASELGLAYASYTYYRSYSEDPDVNTYDLTMAKRFTWFTAAVYAYSLMDAFVDAHLSFFPDNKLELDPGPLNGIGISYNF